MSVIPVAAPAAASAPALRSRDPLITALALGVWLLLGLFVLYPLACLVARAFFDGGALSLQPARELLASATHQRAFVNSLVLALAVGVAGVLLGFGFALLAARAGLSRRGVALLDAACLLPLISPPFTISVAILFSFGARGLITHELLGLRGTAIYGFWSTAAAEAFTYFPIAYLTLRPLLAGIDANMENAAFSMGARRWRVFRTVTLPLTLPGIANAFLLLFACSLADFATPLILAGNQFPVLPTEAFLQITGQFDLRGGALLSIMLLVPAAIVFWLQHHWLRGRSFVTVTGKAGARSEVDLLSPWARRGLMIGCAAVAIAVLYFYALLLYASFVVAFGANHTLTWRHYQVIFTEGLPAIRDTLLIAAIGTPLGGLYGVLVGHLVARKRFAGQRAMEVVSLINYALPGTIVGIAYLLAFNERPIELTGTATIIIACYIFRYSPTGIRATVALLHRIEGSLEEASESLGAGSFTTFRRITLPLILPAFFTGLGVVFIRSMTAISATIFLISIHWTLVTVRILENMTELALGPAAAFSVFVVVVVQAVLFAIGRLLARLHTADGLRMQSVLGG